jgi:hypothetical protein
VAYFIFTRYIGNFLPLPLFVDAKRIYIYFLAIGFLVLIAILAISSYSKIIRIALLILVVPFCCLFSYMSLDFPERILASAKLSNYHYYVTLEGMIDEVNAIYSTYRCNAKDLECKIIYSETSGTVDDVVLIVDEEMQELHVLRTGYERFTDGAQPREILTSEQFGDFIYSIGVYPPYGSLREQRIYMLFKCKNTFVSCEKLPFNYTGDGGSFKLTYEDNTNELKVYRWRYDTEDVLIYSYGIEPKCYVEQCKIQDN